MPVNEYIFCGKNITNYTRTILDVLFTVWSFHWFLAFDYWDSNGDKAILHFVDFDKITDDKSSF